MIFFYMKKFGVHCLCMQIFKEYITTHSIFLQGYMESDFWIIKIYVKRTREKLSDIFVGLPKPQCMCFPQFIWKKIMFSSNIRKTLT